MIRYFPGLAKPLYQGQLKGTLPKKAYVDDTYKDLKTTEFTIQLLANQYMNFHSVHLVFPLKIKKKLTILKKKLSCLTMKVDETSELQLVKMLTIELMIRSMTEFKNSKIN